MRAPFQVIIFPYKSMNDELNVLIGRRRDEGYWQAFSGGGEDSESFLAAAKRELDEEASLSGEVWEKLDSMCMLPKIYYHGHESRSEIAFVVPEYAFMVEVNGNPVCSNEHSELLWCSIEKANSLLKYDSNRIALWELNQRVKA